MAKRPRLLDLFCGGGGASVGYHHAGFEVVGVDIRPQPRYPFEFHQADALTYSLDGFDVIHASPPCQLWTVARHLRVSQGYQSKKAVDCLTPLRPRLVGRSYVIENVSDSPLLDPVVLCGSAFGLRVRRHRLFESSVPFPAPPPCRHGEQGRPIGVYHRMNDSIPRGGRTAHTLVEGQEAMGIDWLPWEELKEAVPPKYTEWVGQYLIAYLNGSLEVS